MVVPPAPAFDAVLERMYQRRGIDTLGAHLEGAHGLGVRSLSPLDVGVFRVERSDGGAPVVARLFSDARPLAAVEGDLAVLRHLAGAGFPAERPFGDDPISTHEDQGVLVTEFVTQVPKAERPPYPIIALGARVARLHALAVPPGADRPAGALHHFAQGTMGDELRVVSGWLDAVEERVPPGADDALAALRAALAGADGGEGLPEALVHPDPVPTNAVFTASGPVLVDWTSSGRGPRLASLALVLRSGWAAAPFWQGYARRVDLTPEERSRLSGLLFSRALIAVVFRACRDPATMVRAAGRLRALQRESDAKAGALLDAPSGTADPGSAPPPRAGVPRARAPRGEGPGR